MKSYYHQKVQSHDSAKAVQQYGRKKLFALAVSAFLAVVMVNEAIRLALLNG